MILPPPLYSEVQPAFRDTTPDLTFAKVGVLRADAVKTGYGSGHQGHEPRLQALPEGQLYDPDSFGAWAGSQ